ncbi:MAG TPA: hypothetical protein VGL73_06715 [Caulobacteraceae bacterium]|jgi:hypothetical protein
MKTLINSVAVLAIAVSVMGCHRHGGGSGRASIRTACATDIQQFCADVDRSQIRGCMKTHADQLSAGCKAAIAARAASRSGAKPAATSAAPAAPANKG